MCWTLQRGRLGSLRVVQRPIHGSWGYGNEHWEFDENGLMQRRDASINDYKIDESERKFRWTR